jgi:cold shock CspA family protein
VTVPDCQSSSVGIVQWVEPAAGFGFISAGGENGGAIYFSFDNVIGQNVMPGDRVRFEIRGDRAVNIQPRDGN